MAERRMFAKTIIDSDAFLDMPPAAQLLYFHLAMRADDDGFVNKPKSILRLTGCTEEDLKYLAEEKFLIPFDSGVVVVRHWHVHNYIRKDAYTETFCKTEKALLSIDNFNAYSTDVSDSSTQVRLGKDRLGKDRLGKSRGADDSGDAAMQPARRFAPPSLDEVMSYCDQRGNKINAERFVDYYTANGWMVGRNKMKDWKAAVRSWEKKEKPKQGGNVFLEMVGNV